LYLLAGVAATWPAVRHFRSDFMSGGAPGHGEASPGDHLQTLYHYWLVGHQVEHGAAPWLDPYTFRPEADAQPNYAGWPFGFLFWPLGALFGLVAGWNLLQLVLYVLAGMLACAWLRELGLPRGPALAGGLVFALAPYRVQQSVGHLLGPIAVLLPLALWAFERSRRGSAWWLVLSGAAVASIPLSGQVHLALGAIPFVLAYALCRTRERRAVIGAIAGAVAAVAAGVLVRETLIKGSTESGGRELAEITHYSANAGDFVSRHVGDGRSEQFVFLGWATPLLALTGLILLVRARRFALAAVLGVGVVVPIFLALGTTTPLYSALWHALPPFRFPRVPERLLPIACLCIAAFVAFAVAHVRRLGFVALVIVLLFVDLRVHTYGSSDAGAPERVAYRGDGRLLELPMFDPSVHYGSVYLWYDTASQRERPGGYSTTAPRPAKRVFNRLERLNCGDWSGGRAREVAALGVRAIAVHLGLYGPDDDSGAFAVQTLGERGWSVTRRAGPVLLFERRRGNSSVLPKPDEAFPHFCVGWYPERGGGRYMSETHSALWVYTAGRPRLRFAPTPFPPRVTVHPRSPSGWRLVTVDIEHLRRVRGVKPRVGARLLAIDM
jgi:hypothetical protein